MKYMGSKSRIFNDFKDIILDGRLDGQYYVEPFVGGCNSLENVSGNRIAGDSNEYLICMWKGLVRDLERPIVIDKELYSKYRTLYNNRHSCTLSDIDKFMIGWVGFMGSFNGRFFDGGYSGHDVNGRDYISEQIRNTESQIPSLVGVDFVYSDYQSLCIPDCSIVYMDIPYKGTTQYSSSKNFDYSSFYSFCIDLKKKGNSVFFSEYDAPDIFKCVWSKEITNSLNTKKTYKPTEKLFTL